MLQCVAGCVNESCSVLQCVAVCGSVLQGVSVCSSVLVLQSVSCYYHYLGRLSRNIYNYQCTHARAHTRTRLTNALLRMLTGRSWKVWRQPLQVGPRVTIGARRIVALMAADIFRPNSC